MKRFLVLGALCIGLLGVIVESARDVTNEDLRSAILALAHITKESADKLAGHDRREQQVAEQLKRSLTGVDRRLNAVDQPLRGVDERLKRLEESVVEIDKRAVSASERQSGVLAGILDTLREMAFRPGAGAQDQAVAVVPVGQALGEEILAAVQRVDQKLQQLQQQLQQQPEQGGGLGRELLEQQHNESLSGLSGLRDTLERLEHRVEDKIAALAGVAQEGKEEVLEAVNSVGASTAGLFADVSKSYETLTKDIGGLASVEKVLVQTGDNVLDAKRRVEYGVHQILLEVGALVKQQSKDLNETLNTRFDQISTDILSHQTDNLGNLSSKIETEISQVWRQIGIMYEQLTASKSMLDRLQQQTEIYVNGSLQTMDGMEGKVGQITGRMGEVDENLNYLLGRLSLVTQEFNQIKSGLASALDNIRKSFLELQGQVTDLGPGPNPIPEEPPSPALMPPAGGRGSGRASGENSVDNHV